MSKEEIFEGLKEIIVTIRPNTDLENVTMKTALLDGLGLDSLTMLLMSLAIETKFGIRFDDPSSLTDVESVVDCIAEKLK